MSFWCYDTEDIVIGEPQVLVPIQIRKIIYISQKKPDHKSDFLQYEGQSEGWETVKAVPVRRSRAEIYAATHPPIIVSEKEVRFITPFKKQASPKKDQSIDMD
jgi:hypothetical protein